MGMDKIRYFSGRGETTKPVSQTLILACGLLATLLATACSQDGPKDQRQRIVEFTQCGAPPSARGPNFKSLPLDAQRQCYGTKWRIPAIYLISKGTTPHKNLETIFLSIDLGTFAPGPGDRFDLYTSIEVRQEMRDWGIDSDKIAREAPTPNVFPTGEVVRDMLVFQGFSDITQSFVFVPHERASYFMYCSISKRKNYKTGREFLEAQQELAGCEVKQKVGIGLYATYHVPRKLLGNMPVIVKNMEKMIDKFIVN